MDKITIVAVSYGKRPCKISDLFAKSIAIHSSGLVDKLVIVHNFESSYYESEKTVGSLKVLEIGRPPRDENLFFHRVCATHEGLKYVDSKYVIISDPDIIYTCSRFDKFYINTYEKYNLMLSGCSHFNKAPYGQHFPCVINMFAAMDKLPPPEWMQGKFKEYGKPMDGQWLSYNKLPEYEHHFPCPKAFWDIGSYLWLWVKQNNGKYLTLVFHPNPTIYNLSKYAANFEMDELIEGLGEPKVFLRHAQKLSASKTIRRGLNPYAIAFDKLSFWHTENMMTKIKLF